MKVRAIDVVKQRGKRASEPFDSTKLYRSIHAACLSVKTPAGHAHDTANHVCNDVVIWCENKQEVTSNDIRRQATKALERFHPDAAYIYQHHKVIM